MKNHFRITANYYLVYTTALILLVGAICILFSFDGLYGQDGYAYLHQLTHIDLLFTSNEFYPPFYAIAGSFVQVLASKPAAALQAVSMLAWLGTSWIVYAIIANHFTENKKAAGMVAFVCFFLSPFVMRMGVLVMSDSLAMFMGSFALYWGLFSKNQNAILFFFVTAALGLLTRYALVVVLLPTACYATIQLIQQGSRKQWAVAVVGILLGLTLLVLNFIFLSNKKGTTQHEWLQLWDIANYFRSTFDHQDGLVKYRLPNLVYAFKNIFHPAYFLLLIPTLAFIRKKDLDKATSKIILLSVVLYALFLAGIPFQNERYLLLTFPFIVILFYPSLERLYNALSNKKNALLLLIPIQICIAYISLQPIVARNALEKKIATALTSYQGSALYSFDLDIALEGRGVNFEYINLWKQQYVNFPVGALVLFNPTKFEQQWKGKNPMLNWENLQRNYEMEVLVHLDDDWKLYKIKHSKF